MHCGIWGLKFSQRWRWRPWLSGLYRSFGGSYCWCLRDRSDNGGRMYLRHDSNYLPNYTVSQLSRSQYAIRNNLAWGVSKHREWHAILFIFCYRNTSYLMKRVKRWLGRMICRCKISASVRNMCQFISCCLVSLTPGAFSPRPALCTDDLTFIFIETFLYDREDLANLWAMSWPCCEIGRNVRHHCMERNTLLYSTLSCFKTKLCDFLHMFYICSSVHRNSVLKKSNKMQQYEDIYLLLNYSAWFGRPSCPSSGVHKTVVAASGTDHTVWEASIFKRDQISPY